MTEHFICSDCGQGFTLSFAEQRFFLERGLSLPKRCEACRARRRQERPAGQGPIPTPARRPSAFTSRGPGTPGRFLGRAGRARPLARFGWLSLGLVGLAGIVALAWLGPSGWGCLAAGLLAANLVALFLYRYDKWVAEAGRTRVPEPVLLALALVGGSPGAFIAMYVFPTRHKTQKGSFLLFYWGIVALQIVGLLLFLGF